MEKNKQLYLQHVKYLFGLYQKILTENNFDAVLIPAGLPNYQYSDDLTYPFKVSPYFKSWLPLLNSFGSYLLISINHTKPQLFFFQKESIWIKNNEIPESFWIDSFDITPINSSEKIHELFPLDSGNIAFIGEKICIPKNFEAVNINPATLITALHFHRAIKTKYEQECIRTANKIAVKGHKAVEYAFTHAEKITSFDIHMTYLKASKQRESELPYDNIIGLNENAGILHHMDIEHTALPANKRHSLLIDAGASCNGYAADITRTYTNEATLFSDLISALDKCQQSIIRKIKPGMSYLFLNEYAHQQIAAILVEFNLVKTSTENCFSMGMTSFFFPHGLGHLLGLQVHDKGGYLTSPKGQEKLPPEQYSSVRLTREIEVNQVFTIEPGLYFIPKLLNRQNLGKNQTLINWSLIESLMIYGGIRIEDNILISETTIDNLTRDAFHEQT